MRPNTARVGVAVASLALLAVAIPVVASSSSSSAGAEESNTGAPDTRNTATSRPDPHGGTPRTQHLSSIAERHYPDHIVTAAGSRRPRTARVVLVSDDGTHSVTVTVTRPVSGDLTSLARIPQTGGDAPGRVEDGRAILRHDEVGTAVSVPIGDGRTVTVVEQLLMASDRFGDPIPIAAVAPVADEVAAALAP